MRCSPSSSGQRHTAWIPTSYRSLRRAVLDLDIGGPPEGRRRACPRDTRTPGRGFLPDRDFASIGYGLPGGIGAALAAPRQPVVAITGDAGFNMMLGELETARRAGIGLTIVVVTRDPARMLPAVDTRTVEIRQGDCVA